MASEPSNAAGRLLGTNSLQNAVDEMARSAASIADSVKGIQRDLGMSSMGFGKSMLGKDLGTIKAQGGANGGGVSFSGGTGGGANHQTFQQRWNNAGPIGKSSLALGTIGQGMSTFASAAMGGDKYQNFIGLNQVMSQYNNGFLSNSQQSNMWGNRFWQGNAQNGGDFNGAIGQISSMGFGTSGSRFNSQMNTAAGVAAMTPGMSLSRAAGVTAAFNSNQSTNMLAAFGIKTMTASGMPQTPTQIAKQILDETTPGWESVRNATDGNISAVIDNPGSKFNQSLSNLVMMGAIGPDQQTAVTQAARKLLSASSKFGVSANQIDHAIQTGNKGLLKKWGIGTSDQQLLNQASGSGRAAQSSEIGAFNSSVEVSTGLLTKFNDALGMILKDTGLGTLVGAAGGASGLIGKVGGLLSSGGAIAGIAKGIGGLFGLGGNSESRMSVGGGAGGGGGAATGGNSESRQSVSKGGSSGGLSFGFPTSDRTISTAYGVRGPMWSWKGYHTGVDFSVPQGTPVMASATGTVIGVGPSAAGAAYGQAVLMDHGNGWQSLYAHNSRVKTSVGSKVSKGTVIAYSGATGNVTGPHVHFEIRRGANNPVDPTPFLKGAMVASGAADTNGSASSGGTGTGTNSSSGSGTQFNNAAGVGLGLGMTESQILGASSGAAAHSTGSSPGSKAGASAPSSGHTLNAGTPGAASGSAAANQALAKRIIHSNSAYKGWDSGVNWNDLVALWNNESGWNAGAVNAGSGAYGIPQILPSAHPGVNVQNDPRGQILWGLNYIKGRYGNPAAAWTFEKSHSPNWYDKGSWNLPKDELAMVHQGEMIIPKTFAESLRGMLKEIAPVNGKPTPSGDKGSIVFHPGAIQLVVGQGATTTQAQSIGRAFVESVLQDDRIKAIQEGM